MAEAYRHRIRIRYGEVDMQRVVFNAHYLAYCDDACERWLAVRGVDVFSHGWDFMLKKAEATITYVGVRAGTRETMAPPAGVRVALDA